MNTLSSAFNILKTLSKSIFTILVLLCLFFDFQVHADDDSNVRANSLVTADLVFDRDIIQFHGSENLTAPRIGIHFKIKEGWHIYWKNPGESGRATTVTFSLPPSWKTKDLEWPTPIRYIEKGNIRTYAYENEVLLFSELQLPPIVPTTDEELEFQAEVGFLVCHDRCIPGRVSLSKRITASSIKPESPSKDFEIFKKFESLVPKKISTSEVTDQVVSQITFDQDGPLLSLSFPEGVTQATLFETTPNFLTRVSTVNNNPENIELVHSFDIQNKNIMKLSGVLAIEKKGVIQSYEFEDLDLTTLPQEKIEEQTTINTFLTHSEDASTSTAEKTTEPTQGIIFYLFAALLGGIILNFMPCVLPVLSIKFFGLVSAKDNNKKQNIRESLFFSFGVIFSFMLLAAIFSVLKLSGQSLGWGFQFQNPYFIFSMIIFLFFMTLSFFDFLKFPSLDCGSLEKRCNQTKHTDTRNFLDGILISILSTPCTAPFMGTAVAFALSQTTVILCTVFFFLAIGLCLPYVLVATNQRLLSFIPKPGPWMQELKHFMGFGLIGTIIWLLSVLGNLVPGSMIYTLICLFVIGICVWIFKITRAYTKFSKKMYLFLLLGLVATIYFSYRESEKHIDNDIEWISFSEFSRDTIEGPYFIDFTADWCITCKYNEHFVIDTTEIKDIIKKKNIKMYKADWTSGDESITKAIKEYGAEGVPLYVVGNSKKQESVLHTILTKEYLESQLESLQ